MRISGIAPYEGKYGDGLTNATDWQGMSEPGTFDATLSGLMWDELYVLEAAARAGLLDYDDDADAYAF
jgi:hypothetical protein